MKRNIVIGKHTLESLTSGMYAEPYVIYREYIQNAADSVDEAYRARLLNHGEERIHISVSPAEKRIVIADNGLGIPAAEAEKTLISIGNSKKTSESSRGFRGIGRLSALSYCTRLTFETSFAGEDQATKVQIDAEKLAKLLAVRVNSDTSAMEVLEQVYGIEFAYAPAEEHYFKVILEGVDEFSKLTDYEECVKYLSQNLPVPYDPQFTWGKEIKKQLYEAGYEPAEYQVFFTYGAQTIPIYKAYQDSFLVDRTRDIKDRISGIELVTLSDEFERTIAIGWLAKTSFLGSICDRRVKGIRLRKGNILIGDYQTLNSVFKDARFNGWSLGEIFAVDADLIPNARRDHFEKNSMYFRLTEQLTMLAGGITKKIRAASQKRNADSAEGIPRQRKVREAVPKTQKSYASTVFSQEVRVIGIPEDTMEREIEFDKLDCLLNQVQGATTFKVLNTMTH